MSNPPAAEKAITLRVEYRDAGHLLDQWRRFLSQGTTFVRTKEPIGQGAPLTLKISFPGLLHPLYLAGSARQVHPEEPGVEVAVTFADPQEKAAMGALIERAAQGDPELCARRIRLLVLEDNPHVSLLISEGLKEAARRSFGGRVYFDFRLAKNGTEGLEALGRGEFEAIICDVYLPELDGAGFITALRQGEHRHLPVLAVSAGGEPARERALAAGANLFLHKPLRLAELTTALEELLGLERDHD